MNMKQKILAGLAFAGSALPVLAEGESGAGTADTVVQTTISELTTKAQGYAGQIAPFVKDVGVAFLAIAVIGACFSVILWGLRKARPGR